MGQRINGWTDGRIGSSTYLAEAGHLFEMGVIREYLGEFEFSCQGKHRAIDERPFFVAMGVGRCLRRYQR